MLHKTAASTWKATLALVFACVLALAGCGASGSTASTADASASTTEQATAASTADSAASSTSSSTADDSAATAAAANEATAFPSWNADSASLKALVEYVNAVTDESSPDYVAPEDRIATFDMDGTIICEKAPFYVDWCMLNNRVLDNPSYNEPEYKPSPETVKICQGIRDTINAGEKPSEQQEKDKARLIASEFAGLTPAQFREFARNFLESVDAVGFDGMTYGKSFYQPMLEVIRYLQAKDFDVWMVSACEREFVRAAVPLELNIAPDHIIGTDVAYAATNQGDEAFDKYNMSQDETVVLAEPLLQETAKTGKSIAIEREIGKRPILAFGNSSGDYSMLNYAQSNPDHKGMGVLVLCDDLEREYGDAERAKEQTAEAEKEGWVLFHMSDEDWATIYGEGVSKTELPGAATKAEETKAEETKADEESADAADAAEAESDANSAAEQTQSEETELAEAA